jgi:membrane-associated phospholipid phosphatase
MLSGTSRLVVGLAVGIGFFALLVAGGIYARWRERRQREPGLFLAVWDNLGRAFSGRFLFLHALALGLTAIIVYTGLDGEVRAFFLEENPLGGFAPYAFLIFGNFWHALVAIGLVLIALRRRNRVLIGAGLAALQALLLSAIVTGWLKLLSGRKGPLHPLRADLGTFRTTDDALDFRFDFWNHGFVDGRFFWPSGHTASIVAFVSALVAFAPEARWLAWVGYPIAALTGLAMIDGQFHWFSDVVAGALIGHCLGWTIGAAFRARYREPVPVAIAVESAAEA